MKKVLFLCFFIVTFMCFSVQTMSFASINEDTKIIENSNYTTTTILRNIGTSQISINVKNCNIGNVIILALYNNDRLSDVCIRVYIGETIEYITDKEYDLVKVFGWENINTLKPLYSLPNCKYAIDESEHEIVIDAYVAPTNSTTGLTEGKHCSRCGKIIVAQEIIEIIDGYIVTFDSQGGSQVSSQVVAEGKKATKPISPTKQGYDFDGWYYDETEWIFVGYVVTENMTLTAKWSPSSDTNYTVNYHLENLEKDGYTTIKKNYEGTTDSTIYAPIIEYSGFSSPSKQSITIRADGTTCVDYYYKRNEYTINFVTNGGSILEKQKFSYGQDLSSLLTPIRDNMTFSNWYKDIKLTSLFDDLTMPDENLTLYAHWEGETKPSSFQYSSGNGITISKLISAEKEICVPSYIGGVPVKTIKAEAFKNSDITSVVIPNTVTYIGKEAFMGCNFLEYMSLPFVGEKPPTNEDETFGEYNEVFGFIFGYKFSSKVGTTFDGYTFQVYVPKKSASQNSLYYHYAIPESIKTVVITGSYEIPNHSFSGCRMIESIILPNSVTEIKESTFSQCSSLKELIIPSSVATIDDDAFYGCGIKTLKIPNNVNSIGHRTFWDCNNLEEVYIEDGTTCSIGSYAFDGCSNLKTVVIPDSVTAIYGRAFYGCENATIYLKSTAIPSGFSYDWNCNYSYPDDPCYIKYCLYSENELSTNGNYWHYVNGVITKW